MWKKLSIFLVVFLLVVSSLSAYPSWLYGGGKSPIVSVEVLPEETTVSEPEQTATETAPVEGNSIEPETLETSLTAESESLSETLKEQGESLVNSLTDSRVKAAAVTQVSEYIDNAVLGVEVMEEAYEQEVANHKDTEARYNELAGRRFEKDFYVTVNPFVSYAPITQTWGLGLNTIYAYKGIGLSIGAYVPSIDVAGLKGVVVTAGLSFTF